MVGVLVGGSAGFWWSLGASPVVGLGLLVVVTSSVSRLIILLFVG